MRIGDVMAQTGLTKKAIYYYIREGLIAPESERKSGYLIFTEEHLGTLRIIRKLRALDLSIDDIRSILDYTNTTNYYFIRKLKELDRQRSRMDRQGAFLRSILDPINVISTRENLISLLDALSVDEESRADEKLDNTDAIMISAFFWGNFLHNAEITEYRRFLWDRLIKHIVSNPTPELLRFRDHLYQLTQQETQKLFAKHSEVVDGIAALAETDYATFVKTMIETVARKLEQPAFIRLWKAHYKALIHPSACFFDSAASDIMREFSPHFMHYQRNINICCFKMRAYLETAEGAGLRTKILSRLSAYIDIDGHHSGELAALYSYF